MTPSIEELRSRYGTPTERARQKTLAKLDENMKRVIALSPFVCMATSSAAGSDVTPRGGDPGFVRILDETTIALPDWPGNRRLDSFENLTVNPNVGLLFFVPGMLETLRVNGSAEIVTAGDLLGLWKEERRQPQAVVRISVREAFLHCGKALLRSRLWDLAAQIDRKTLPTYGSMLKDQVQVTETADEIDAQLASAYKTGLYS
jgi:uncharacterized protein